ncbi:MAG: type transport system ATP-binding protein [Solirubrobacteraceae bacterium]|jgi:ABC-2 type transport system ATP-binding protein|nr:type transport system ATP-binding protein [Solirubrobacteraceae bacterium]MEA2468490.1 type transport system ATP-binding protein [Thermoleophilaceae bacterium]
MSSAPLNLVIDPPEALPSPAEDSILALRGITKEWRTKRGPLRVLDSVDLDLRPGTTTWVCGQNGVGKTTVLRIAAGLIKPDSGSVCLAGLSPERDRRAFQRSIGFLPAGDRGLYPRLTVKRHLEYWSSVALVPRKSRSQAVARSIEDFGLTDLADRRTDRMSLGQRQRLRLAMTFLHNPSIILVDEPLNSLDSDGAAALESALERVKAQGGAALWCSPLGEGRKPRYDASYVIEHGRLQPA